MDAAPLSLMNSPSSASAIGSHSCVLCPQRKIKCDKQQPCFNCVRAQKECVQIAPAPPRRRKGMMKLSEEQLLRRLRQYECYLRAMCMKIEDLERLDDDRLKPSASPIVPNAPVAPGKAFPSMEVKQLSSQGGNSGSPVQRV
jgi:hypothetical protein